jgi:hypothetical protein
LSSEEARYHRKEHQPLGKKAISFTGLGEAKSLNDILPEFTKEKDFRFGRKIVKGTMNLVFIG